MFGDGSHLVPQAVIGLGIEHTRHRLDLDFADPRGHIRFAPDVPDPQGSLTRLGKEVKPAGKGHEPNLDLARQTGLTPDRGQIENLCVRNVFNTCPHSKELSPSTYR